MKLNRLEDTKRLYPHWLDRNDNSNFVKHLKVINNQQLDLYHKLKTLDWARMLEKPIQIWKEQNEGYKYTINFHVSIKFIKEINIYKNPKISKDGTVDGYDEIILHEYYPNDDVDLFDYSHNDSSEKMIPRDTYIIEVFTWDEYHFLKGFPENDYLFYNELDYKFNEAYLKINYEEISYSKFLTFRVHMDKIKLIEIFKNEDRIYIEDFFNEGYINNYFNPTEYSYQYFDYTNYESFEDVYEIESPKHNPNIIYRAHINKDEYVYRLPLTDDDFEMVFDLSLFENEFQNEIDYIVLEEPEPSEETYGKIAIINENGKYNAYKTIHTDNEYLFELLQSDLSYTLGALKDNYDLFVTIYDKNGKCSKKDIIDFTEVLSKSYTIDGCLDTVYKVSDCIIINELPAPSENTLKNLLVVKENGVYNGYKTLLNNETGRYYYTLLLEDIEYTTINNYNGDRIYKKRYSGYDDILGDCFDHDYSLDMIGHLFNVHRYKFKPIPYKNEYYYSKTYPLFNNRYTEDDYHYMKRIQYYIQNYNQIYFPVLEFWKYYHTDSTLVNRKSSLGVQDRSFIRTNYDSTCLDEDGKVILEAETLIDEEFDDDATISDYTNIDLISETNSLEYVDNTVYYNVNKATITNGSSNPVTTNNHNSTWHEARIIHNVFVVPNVNYRLRYGVSQNQNPVTIRMICFSRNGHQLHSIGISDDSDDLNDETYPKSENYDYVDKIISIPSDTAYIIVMLESNSSFEYADVSFQRETVVGFDNRYMKSSLNWNSCVYDLYVDYDDIPVNLMLDDDFRFNLLFKRSLPLTKIGVLNLNIKNNAGNYLEIGTSYGFEITDYFGFSEESYQDINEKSFIIENNYLEVGKTYSVEYYCKSKSMLDPIIDKNDDYLIATSIDFYTWDYQNIGTFEYSDKIYSTIEAKVNFTFTVPENVENARILINSTQNFDLWGVSLTEYNGDATNE